MRTQQLLLAAAGAIGLVILILVIVAFSRGDGDGAARVKPGVGFVSAVEKAQAATVMLSVSGGGEAMPMGSGFVVTTDGLIVTAAHVTGGMPVVNAVFADGSVARAELVGTDDTVDVAVFRTTPGKPMKALSFADSNLVRAGQPVVLMGAPFGLAGTATSGIVSAVNRQIGRPASPVGEARFADGALRGPVVAYIQTDAALTSGGSGGPLLNVAGEVIGLATSRESRGDPGAGLSFAIPSNVVKQVVERFKTPPAPAA
ncbi:MAG: trypsin-like peptidase domain-containing protein [Phenylobacterium sp.]|uniref:S1C family serine protease n=1 Tax=Phenylobacterium sp. TaxID=1871053 RepID=UPI00273750B2|nr:trypsin-like peptidase domain-containing protein [Phenylobacterium sp.]MDP3748885.1 trypsin-like peptidase domain-containing protein [Phenylobacterium sp.]